jgi:hypothetical protein
MRPITLSLGLAAAVLVLAPRPADPACCYFSAMGQDVNQPAQKAFITWDAEESLVSWTVQPKFEGNALDFGMVIPTPSQPKLAEMPRDFFKELAVFTILKPMDLDKYKMRSFALSAKAGGAKGVETEEKAKVRILESGVVGSLDYKIIAAEKAEDLFTWLKENKYNFAGDTASLDHYTQKGWFFTVMKIDPKQMKKNADGSYAGEVTPTRFQFSSKVPIYPIRITQISVKTSTEALFYILAKNKMDLPGGWSHRYSFLPMWSQALSYAIPEKLTKEEKEWNEVVKPKLAETQQKAEEIKRDRIQLTRLEYAKRLTEDDMNLIDGSAKYDRQADKEAIDNLKILKGHLRKGLFLTKCRKVFVKDEMRADLVFVDATFNDKQDSMEYDRILPTSPP